VQKNKFLATISQFLFALDIKTHRIFGISEFLYLRPENVTKFVGCVIMYLKCIFVFRPQYKKTRAQLSSAVMFFVFYVLFEHSFTFELFGLMTAKLK